MSILKHTTVLRKAGSHSYRKFKEAADIVALGTRYDNTLGRELRLSFTTSGPGGTLDTPGSADYRILIGTKDYEAVITAMCDVDREAALLAAASVLVPHLTAIKEERDAAQAREAEEHAEGADNLAKILAPSQ